MSDLIPENIYTACVIPMGGEDGGSIQFGESTKKKTPYANVKLGILEGDQSGQTIYWTGYLTPATIVKTMASLHALGFKGTNFNAFLTQQPSKSVSITIEHEEYEGRKRARVRWINPEIVKLAPSALDALTDQYADLAATAPPSDAPTFDENGDELKF